jgi:RNA polymerase sigma factor (sigma-70 family)
MDNNVTFKIALKVKAQHGVLKKFMEDNKLTGRDFANMLYDDLDTSKHSREQKVYSWINLHDYPHDPVIMCKLCELMSITPEELFPEFIRDARFRKLSKETILYRDVEYPALMSSSEILALPANTEDIDNTFLNEEIDKQLATLTEREAKIIRMRLGFDGEEYTLDKVAEHFGLSRGRVTQIESKALRKLKHPARRKQFIGFNGTYGEINLLEAEKISKRTEATKNWVKDKKKKLHVSLRRKRLKRTDINTTITEDI